MSKQPAVDKSGFLLRGAQATRLEAFVDAAFAFAVTLLVIGGTELPTSIAQLQNALKDVPAFAASFAVIAQIWWSHYKYSQRYGLEDGKTTLLSLMLVFLVLVYVYPLKMLSASFFAWLSNGWLLTRSLELRGIDDLRAMFTIYGLAWSVLSVLMALLYMHALRLRERLALSPIEIVQTRFDLSHWWLNLAFGLTSALIAMNLPDQLPQRWMYGLPGLLYFGLGPMHGLMAWFRARALRRLPEA